MMSALIGTKKRDDRDEHTSSRPVENRNPSCQGATVNRFPAENNKRVEWIRPPLWPTPSLPNLFKPQLSQLQRHPGLLLFLAPYLVSFSLSFRSFFFLHRSPATRQLSMTVNPPSGVNFYSLISLLFAEKKTLPAAPFLKESSRQLGRRPESPPRGEARRDLLP